MTGEERKQDRKQNRRGKERRGGTARERGENDNRGNEKPFLYNIKESIL